jgi:histidine triad (HIT) family protein
VYADSHVQALVSLAPINRYHVIIVPRIHVERLPDLPVETAVKIVIVAQQIGRAMVAAAAPDGIMYITEDDLTDQGYNLVAHWKLHVIARFKDDAVRIDWARTADPGLIERTKIAENLRRHVSPIT